MMRALLAAGLLAGTFNTVGFVVDRNSFGQPRRWKLDPPDNQVHTNVVNRATRAVRYFLASDGYSTGNTAAELNALRASFAQWQAISGTHLKFEDAGLIAPGVDVNTDDNTNVLFWAKSSTLVNGGNDDIANALGVTFSSFFSDNTLAEADVVFNGVIYSWFTDFNDTNAAGLFIESVALHELGHLIGLRHSPVGGATMLWRGRAGVNLQTGLAPDEISAARWNYPLASPITGLAQLRGRVRMNGSPVFGAAVVVEETGTGNLIAGTVTQADGTYEIPALPPGVYLARVSPLDSSTATAFLVRGRDIASSFSAAETEFLPGTNVVVTLNANQTVTQDFAVTAGSPPFRITHVRTPTSQSSAFTWSPLPAGIRVGDSNLFVGIASATLPTGGAALTIAGDGLTLGAPSFQTVSGLNFVSVPISVSAQATPGLRSFVLESGAGRAVANGFLEILPAVPDHNFDGLDDRFQRQHFPLFTSSAAAPGSDPDADGFNNQAEYISGTVPTDALSLLRIESVTLTASGSTIACQSGPGRRYQLWSRRDLDNAQWQKAGVPIEATGSLLQITDPTATNEFRFYRVEALP